MKLVKLEIERDWAGNFSLDRQKMVCKVTYDNKDSSFYTVIHNPQTLNKILFAISDILNENCAQATEEFRKNIILNSKIEEKK